MIRFERTKHAPSQYHINDIVGFLQLCWDVSDPRTAIEQHDEREIGNGPFGDFKGFKFNPDTLTLKYKGDPPYKPWARAYLPLTKETILVYKSAWVNIVQEDGSFRVDRRD